MSSFATKISDRRLLQLLAAATLLYWIALTIVMHIPRPPTLRQPEAGLPTDKTVHFVLYAGMATALFLTFEQRARVRPTSKPRSRLGRAALLFVFCAVHGYLEEFTQPLTGREYDLSDFAADSLGASIALGVCLLIARLVSARTS